MERNSMRRYCNASSTSQVPVKEHTQKEKCVLYKGQQAGRWKGAGKGQRGGEKE
jgi:hypothetical protein